jgi:hypothetical protein
MSETPLTEIIVRISVNGARDRNIKLPIAYEPGPDGTLVPVVELDLPLKAVVYQD